MLSLSWEGRMHENTSFVTVLSAGMLCPASRIKHRRPDKRRLDFDMGVSYTAIAGVIQSRYSLTFGALKLMKTMERAFSPYFLS
jgi:hypothetical protein